MSNRVVFTLSQWQELEQQALIFKYLVEGIPVPPNLLLPIRRSFHSALFQNPTGGWGPILGSKVDPEPGRCRRTDGKKWRCSKDADPDSKYCERHRSRSRSRKHVETQTVSQSSSIDRSLPATGTHDQSLRFRSFNSFNPPDFGLNISQAQVQHGLYEPSSQGCRYLPGGKDEIKHHSFFTEASGSSKCSKIDSLHSSWNLEPSRVNPVPPSKHPSESILNSNYPLLLALENPGTASISAALPKEEQCCFVGSDTRKLGTGESTKIGRELGGQPLQRFFDEWPVTGQPWSHFEEDGQNPASFCTTQLSISIPMSSDFAGTNYHPP